MEAQFFCATLKSDSGKHNVWLSATDEPAAEMILQTTQGCPKSAILKLVKKTKKQFNNRNK